MQSFVLDRCYARGEGVLRNLPDAVAWYTKAAEHGHIEAQFELGMIFLQGAKSDQGPNTPASWMRMATDHAPGSARQKSCHVISEWN